MNDEKTKMILLVVVVLALAGVVYWQFSSGMSGATPTLASPTSAPGTSPQATAPAPPLLREVDVNLDLLIEEIREVDFEYVPAGRNPMIPLVGRVYFATRTAGEHADGMGLDAFELMSIAQRMEISGIVWDPQAPLAVIDNVIVRPGHTFPGVNIRVHEIGPTSVTLEVEDSLVELTLEER